MRALSWVLVASMGIGLLAGCFGPDASPESTGPAVKIAATIDAQAIARRIGEPIEVDHDHRDPVLHGGGFNLDFVAWSSLGVGLGRNGFANFVFFEDEDESLVLIAIDGDNDGGFVIADARDPHGLVPLGRYTIQGSGMQEVRVFPGGRYALLNVQEAPTPQQLGDGEGAKDCSVCLQVVDIRDRARPAFASAFPVDLLGSHNMHIQPIGPDVYVFYVGQPLTNAPPGNYVGIARFVETPNGAFLVKVAEYRHEEAALDPKRSFPHDVYIETHPITKQVLLYVSHWEGGAIVVDVSNPLAPRELAVHKDPAPSRVSNIHWFVPEARARGHQVLAWSAPEIGALSDGSGLIRAYDITDPGRITQVGTWDLPGNVTIPGRYIFSPHTTSADLERGLLAVSHYHAGAWVLDIRDPTQPQALGYYIPLGDPTAPYAGPIWWKKPNFSPDGFLPNVYQVRWKDGLLWVSERGTGLYVLDYTGPVPGPF